MTLNTMFLQKAILCVGVTLSNIQEIIFTYSYLKCSENLTFLASWAGFQLGLCASQGYLATLTNTGHCNHKSQWLLNIKRYADGVGLCHWTVHFQVVTQGSSQSPILLFFQALK